MQLKFEIGPSDSHPSGGFPVSKHETNSKFQCSNAQNRDIGKCLSISCFGHLDFDHSDLFRILILSFGLPTLRVGPQFRYSDLMDVLSLREPWST